MICCGPPASWPSNTFVLYISTTKKSGQPELSRSVIIYLLFYPDIKLSKLPPSEANPTSDLADDSPDLHSQVTRLISRW